MGAPIRSAEEITQIINRGQHAIASLGLEIVQDAKRGADNADPEWRWKQMRLILLRSFYQNILTVDGTINNFYSASANEKAKNNILTGILKLSGIYSGPAIPKLTDGNLPMYFFPSTSGVSTGGNSGGAATPGGITFEALDVDAPGEVVDRIEANGSNYAFYIVNVYGNGSGEGSKGAVLLVTWRGSSTPVVTEYGGADVGGSTVGVTFSAALVSGFIELTANVPTDNWTIRGTRISFQNISFQNPLGPLPTGGTTGQYLRKSSNADYVTEWSTLLWQYITDVTASLAEINQVTGVTSPIQTQLNALTTALGNYLLLTGGTMSGAIAMGGSKITGLGAGSANGDALRYEQLIGLYLLLSGGTMSGNIAMGGNKVTGLAAASGNGEAVRYEQILSFLSAPLSLNVLRVPKATGSSTLEDGSMVDDGTDVSLLGAFNAYSGFRSEIGGAALKTKVVNIGDWNMDSTTSVNVAHGVADFKKIRNINVIIRNDADSIYYNLYVTSGGGNTVQGSVDTFDGTNITLARFATGTFDSTDFNSTSYNRGWITITYEA